MPYVVTLIFVVVGAVAVVWAQRRILARVAVRFDRDSLDFLTGQLLALPMSYFAKRKVGDIERRLQSMGQVRRIVVQGGITAISSLALVLAVIVAMILEAPVLGVAFLVVVPLYGALMWVSRRRVRPIMAAMEEAMARYSASQVDLLKGVETVKTLWGRARTAHSHERGVRQAQPAPRERLQRDVDIRRRRPGRQPRHVYCALRRAGCLLRACRPHLRRGVRRVHRTGAARLLSASRADVRLGRRPVDVRPPGQAARRARDEPEQGSTTAASSTSPLWRAGSSRADWSSATRRRPHTLGHKP